MWSNNFSGTVIFFDENKVVIILPMTFMAAVFSREKLKNVDLKIGGEVFVTGTKVGYDLAYRYKKLKPGQEAILEELRDRYLEYHA